jgi:hypothetical protein
MPAEDRWKEQNGSPRRIAEHSSPRQTEESGYGGASVGNETGQEQHINDDRDRYRTAPDEAETPALDGWDRPLTAKPESVNAATAKSESVEGAARSSDEADWRVRTQPVATSWSTPRPGTFAGKGPKDDARADRRLFDEVCERLRADDQLDASDVTVTVRAAEVTLEGTVADRHARERAEAISASVSGIREVHNHLRAQPGLLSEIGERLGRD